jgi:hypothetical protein
MRRGLVLNCLSIDSSLYTLKSSIFFPRDGQGVKELDTVRDYFKELSGRHPLFKKLENFI